MFSAKGSARDDVLVRPYYRISFFSLMPTPSPWPFTSCVLFTACRTTVFSLSLFRGLPFQIFSSSHVAALVAAGRLTDDVDRKRCSLNICSNRTSIAYLKIVPKPATPQALLTSAGRCLRFSSTAKFSIPCRSRPLCPDVYAVAIG